MPSGRSDVFPSNPGLTRRRTGGVAVLGGLLSVLATALTYGPYVGPFARTTPEPMSGTGPVIVAQAVAGLLLVVACLGLPRPVRATRSGRVGQYLCAGSLVAVSLFPLPALAVLGGGLTPVLLTTAVGYLGALGVAVGTALLARRLAEAAVLSRAGALGLALSLPLGAGGYWLLGRIVPGDLPTPVFGPVLFLAPFGLAWVLVGYRMGTRSEGR